MDNGSKYKINSNSFSELQNNKLSNLLKERFNINNKVIKESNGFYAIHIKDEKALYNIIKPYLFKEFEYKFNTNIKIADPDILDCNYKQYGGNFVTRITPAGKQTVYDFEVKDNHNFLVSTSKQSSKLIVHNCQDTTGVTLEIIKLINSKKKLFLGDKHQNIYEFMETVNAFDVLDNTIKLKLTKSFRCNQYIGEIVQEFGKKHLDDNFIFTGNEN